MEAESINYARTQADGLDNIAPSLSQGQAAWQYALTDNFLSPEEQSAVLRKQLEPYQLQLEKNLEQIGWGPERLSAWPQVAEALFSGKQTVPLIIYLTPDLKLEGSLRIVMTEAGPDIRVTPILQSLTIPEEIGGIRLSSDERNQLLQEGALARPLLMAENGSLVPTFLRVDDQTNTVELWQVRTEQLPTNLLGIDLTKEQQLQLISGHSVQLAGLLDQQGEPFTATVSVSAARQALQFSDVNRLDVQITPDRQFHQQIAHNNEGAKTDQTLNQETTAGTTIPTHKQLETIKDLPEPTSGEPIKRQAKKIS
ncbi:DUF3945 domain-containing protein [Spirosoma sp. HMF4905]|uniref:DUF3945 domain-containing protein n=1 Tax=Spirosoma arboris TaxID=2682092 RepID=A0A7K1SJ96_9BACT|nr:DUF3945 domain-containing protein [Spirosoma arboris]MVM33887.1 DUF3945 domain-containing protein [Spirosoma arboris]